MLVNTEPYLRKKGNKWIIEKKTDGKTIYIKTLDINLYLELTKRHDEASQKEAKNDEKTADKFAYSLLTEQQEEDALKRITPSEEDIKRLWELTK